MFRSLFDPNSAFFRGMERVWTLVVLNVLWVFCSLPVVTIGPSTAGESDTGGGQPHGEKIFRRMAGELQVCPAGMAAHAGGAGSVRL